MKKTTPHNPRTNEQNRKLHWLFGQLGITDPDAKSEIIYNFTGGRTCRSRELEFIECMELIKWLDNTLKSQRLTKSERIDQRIDDDPERVKLDKLRKGLIKAIFRWYELRGFSVTMDYVKATACRAAGVERFNRISPSRLTDLYHEFCRKQKAVDEISKDDFSICPN